MLISDTFRKPDCLSHTGRLLFNSKHQWDPLADDSRVSMTCRETVNQAAYHREADITQPVLMICEVLYIVPESLGASSDM